MSNAKKTLQANKFENMKVFPDGNQQNPNFVATTTTIYGFQGDTLIGNLSWNKLYSTKDSLFLSNLSYIGLIRSENDRIFYLDTLNQIDTLYDFNLNIGDSVLYNFYGNYPEKISLIQIDSIVINAQFYKRFKFAEPVEINSFDVLSEIWIEGIGSIHGPVFPNLPRKFSQEWPDSVILTCSFSNNQPVWQNPSYNNCYLDIVLNANNESKNICDIYPNPFNDKIFITGGNKNNYELVIINGIGQELIRKKLSSETESVDLSIFKDGIYFFIMESYENRFTRKMIKKH